MHIQKQEMNSIAGRAEHCDKYGAVQLDVVTEGGGSLSGLFEENSAEVGGTGKSKLLTDLFNR